MKIFTIIMKVLAALATVAGAIYLAATYGDKIVAWAKKMLGCTCCCDCDCEDCDECACECCECEEAAEEAAEEPVAEPAVEEVVEEAIPETDVVAAEADFEG